MLKVIIIVGTRPEIIKLSRVLCELKKHMNCVLVHTGQNYDYELNQIFFKDLAIPKPDYFLGVAEESLGHTLGNIIIKSNEVFEKEKPDVLLIYGDTNSCLSVIPAKRRKIPVFHMEAGNRCFDQRVPEELNRKVIDHLSDINMTISEHARRYLIAEGIRPETIIKIGSCMKEIINYYSSNIVLSNILDKMQLKSENYFVLSMHREENVESPEKFNSLIESINAIAEKYKKRIIFSVHPRTRKKLSSIDLNPLIEEMKPLGFFDYLKLQKNASCVISDSGTITEESSILCFPAITIRETHERPEGMDGGILIMTGLKTERILESLDIMMSQRNMCKTVKDYNINFVSKKVVNIIQSYSDYVNKVVWRKND